VPPRRRRPPRATARPCAAAAASAAAALLRCARALGQKRKPPTRADRRHTGTSPSELTAGAGAGRRRCASRRRRRRHDCWPIRSQKRSKCAAPVQPSSPTPARRSTSSGGGRAGSGRLLQLRCAGRRRRVPTLTACGQRVPTRATQTGSRQAAETSRVLRVGQASARRRQPSSDTTLPSSIFAPSRTCREAAAAAAAAGRPTWLRAASAPI